MAQKGEERKHNLQRFNIYFSKHSAFLYFRNNGTNISKPALLPTIYKSVSRQTSDKDILFDIAWKVLSSLHKQHHNVDASYLEVSKSRKYTKDATRRVFMALETSAQSSTPLMKEPTVKVMSQSYCYRDTVNTTAEKRPFTIVIQVKETALPLDSSEAADPQISLLGSKDFFDQESMLSVLESSFQHLVRIIDEDQTPLHRSPTRLAVYIFGLFDQISQMNRLSEVVVTVMDDKKHERYWHRMDRTELKRSGGKEKAASKNESSIMKGDGHRAFIALGSNVGNRIGMLEAACILMKSEDIMIERSSSLYETKPMYVERQDHFINSVCQIKTKLRPTALLGKLQEIEQRLGRVKTVDKGPRSIDLDILYYDGVIINQPDLTIPHKLMFERAFVIRPLCDIAANEWVTKGRMREPDWYRHRRSSSFKEVLPRLTKEQGSLYPVTPLCPSLPPIISESPTRETHLMAILNLTPDSFSDGGIHRPDPSSLLNTLHTFVADGATIVDVGGQSSRPGAADISAEEETARILPAITLMRSNPEFEKVAISVDTYRASVAEAAIRAGAHIVNDISAGLMDPKMLPTIARLGCTVILGHVRGTPLTMNKMTNYGPSVVQDVGEELSARLRAAEEAGIYRWRIILDPGIGFAKNQQQNLNILRNFQELREMEGLKGLPWCVGSSRKGFIGKITGVEVPKDRIMGSAMCVAAAIQGGAEIVRAHDVRETAEAIKMADAIWRVEGELQKEPEELLDSQEAQEPLDSELEDLELDRMDADVDFYNKG